VVIGNGCQIRKKDMPYKIEFRPLAAIDNFRKPTIGMI
jgi:hypothetical protein